MLKITQIGSHMPASLIVDPSAQFQAGQAGQLSLIGSTIVCTVSDGVAPLGIIDDYRTKSFSAVSWEESVIVPIVPNTTNGNTIVSTVDVKVELKHPSIIRSSFASYPLDVILNENNGVVTFIAGTPLNFDANGSGIPTGLQTFVNYTYFIPNIPGDDSTAGSGRITLWYERMFFVTDQIETNMPYTLRAPLYVSENGLLTTRKIAENAPSIGMVTAPPVALTPVIEALWY